MTLEEQVEAALAAAPEQRKQLADGIFLLREAVVEQPAFPEDDLHKQLGAQVLAEVVEVDGQKKFAVTVFHPPAGLLGPATVDLARTAVLAQMQHTQKMRANGA